MASESAPRLGLPLLVWIVLSVAIALACAPVVLGIALVLGAR